MIAKVKGRGTGNQNIPPKGKEEKRKFYQRGVIALIQGVNLHQTSNPDRESSLPASVKPLAGGSHRSSHASLLYIFFFTSSSSSSYSTSFPPFLIAVSIALALALCLPSLRLYCKSIASERLN